MKFIAFIYILLHYSLLYSQENDSMVYEIPKTKSGNPSYIYKSIKESQKNIGLKNIENGVDSMEIRIYYLYPKRPGPFDDLLIIRWDSNKWFGGRYSNGLKYFEPEKITWSDLVKKLVKHRIFDLKNMYDIEGFNYIVKDGYGYVVEVAKKNFYRFYYYNSPWQFKKFKDAREMNRIIKLLERKL